MQTTFILCKYTTKSWFSIKRCFDLSSDLKQKLRTCFKKLQQNIKMVLKSTNRLSSLFCFKDVIPKDLQSLLVYKFLCSNCNVT